MSNKYSREIKPGVLVDVYDVLVAFNVTCPAAAHALKKMLAPGLSSSKSSVLDKKEAIASLNRSIEIEQVDFDARMPDLTGGNYEPRPVYGGSPVIPAAKESDD